MALTTLNDGGGSTDPVSGTSNDSTDVPGAYEDTSDNSPLQGSRENRQVTTAVVNDDPIPTGSTYVNTSTEGGDGSITTVAENTGGYSPPAPDTEPTDVPTNATTALADAQTALRDALDGGDVGVLAALAAVALVGLAAITGGGR